MKSNNPWLSIPASDYEGHMASDEVRQLQFLSDLFKEHLAEFLPRSLAVLGCATGNGFERVDPSRTQKVIGIDINQEYLDILRKRFADRIQRLDLICGDLAVIELLPRSLEFIWAALVLEYVEPAVVIEKISRWLKPEGVFAALLQLEGSDCEKVTQTRYESLKMLDPFIKLVDPGSFKNLLRQNGFAELRSNIFTLHSGKRFLRGLYRLPAL